MYKTLRGSYFKQNQWVKNARQHLGAGTFDEMYRSLYRFLSTMHVGQYFIVSNICKKDPGNHYLVVGMCEIYNNMDFFVNLEYDRETDRITILPPHKLSGWNGVGGYHPPDIYSKIIKKPQMWNVNPSDL